MAARAEFYKSIREAKGMMVCNPSTQEADASGSRVRGQPMLQSETLLKKNNKEKVKKKIKREVPNEIIFLLEHPRDPLLPLCGNSARPSHFQFFRLLQPFCPQFHNVP